MGEVVLKPGVEEASRSAIEMLEKVIRFLERRAPVTIDTRDIEDVVMTLDAALTRAPDPEAEAMAEALEGLVCAAEEVNNRAFREDIHWAKTTGSVNRARTALANYRKERRDGQSG